MIQGSELDFGVVLICLSTLAKKLSLPYQTHLQSRSFRMKGQSSSFSTAPGLAETDVLILSELPWGGPFLSVLWALGGLCVGFVWSGSPESVPRRGHTLDLRCKSSRMNTCAKIVGGCPHHLRALLRVSTMCRHMSKALRGFAVVSRVLREAIGSALGPFFVETAF